MPNPTQLLQYWFDATHFGGGGEVCFDSSIPAWTIDSQRLLSGLLEADMTREVLGVYAKQCPDAAFGERPVPIVICARWFVPEDGGKRMPLLLLPGTLDVGGTLRLDADKRPWIPWQRMTGDGTATEPPTVCTLDALCAHQATMGELPDDGSWRTSTTRALALFDAVCAVDGSLGVAGHISSDAPSLRIWDCPDSFIPTARMLQALKKTLEEKGEDFTTAPLRVLLGIPRKDTLESRTNVLPNDKLLEPKLLCGLADNLQELSSGDRDVLLEFSTQHDGDSLVVRAASGTNAPTVAICAMANHLTECALRGERVPTMALFASRETIGRLARRLANRPPSAQTALPSRWLPRIDQGASDSGRRRVLGPIPSSAMCFRTWSEQHAAIPSFESIYDHPLLGDSYRYCEDWYMPRALTYYLDCVSSYLGRRIRDVIDAARLLSERLRRVDQDRCDLVDAYANVCHASEVMKQRDALLRRIVDLRTRHSEARNEHARWSQLAMEFEEEVRAAKRSKNEKQVPSEAEFIVRHIGLGESIPQGMKTIVEICEVYRVELEHIEADLVRLREASAEANRRVRSYASEGQRCAQAIAVLQGTCTLTTQQTKDLETIIDGRDVSMQRLDDMLDKTVRPAEFWLAVHIYEAYWLSMAQQTGSLRRALGHSGVAALRASSNLSPINLVPIELASAFSLEARGKLAQTPIPPLDLAVILDAGQMSVAAGATILGNASRALVFGSESSLGPLQPQGRMSDQLYASKHVQDEWEQLESASLCMSGTSSLAKALFGRLGGSVSALRDVRSAYGELNDLRTDLCPNERLRSVRVPSNSADDPTYPLLGIVPTLSHVLVPDSSWQQVGSSRTNHAEALAIKRWLARHGEQILQRYERGEYPRIGVVSAYKEQAKLLERELSSLEGLPEGTLEVVSLREAQGRIWPLVIASATCGPTAYQDDCACDAAQVLSLMAACAQDAFLLFWGGTWLKSDNRAALTYVRRSAMVGRLYSVVRERREGASAQVDSPRHLNPGARLGTEPDLRAKPMSLTSMLRKLQESGELTSIPATSKMNLALEQVGLIERIEVDGMHKGWRPTPAGREIGILTTTDRRGNPFCSYAPSTKAVIVSTALTVLEA